MNTNTLVSVNMIFFNAGPFIEEAIESVFAQTYDHWELLLVDDGSTDNSTEIARRFLEQYPEKVRYFEHEGHENRGISVTQNLGIRNARGRYISFLDADDVLLPNALAEQVAIMEVQPEAAIVYGLNLWWYGWTGNPADTGRDFTHELGVPVEGLIQPPKLLDLFFFRQKAAIPCPTGILVKREVVERVGGFEESLRLYTDQSFYAKICLREPVFAANKCWSKYRQHPRSVCAAAKKNKKEYALRVSFLKWLEGYLVRQKVTDDDIWEALEKEIRRCRHPQFYRSIQRMKHVARLVGSSAQQGRSNLR